MPLRYETGDEAAEREAAEEALRYIPPRMLADELVRRIAVPQTDTEQKQEKRLSCTKYSAAPPSPIKRFEG